MQEKYATVQATGEAIVAPPGWALVPEGEFVPQVHREYTENYGGGWHGWASPRRYHSTMTPIRARVFGGVRAFAVPEATYAL
jgi:hypothetical protein